MRTLFPRLMAVVAALAVSACVALAPAGDKAEGPNPVTGGEIEVTSLDAPAGKAGQAKDTKPEGGNTVVPEDAPKVEVAPVADAKAAPDAPTVKPKPRPEAPVADAAPDDLPPAPEAAEPEPGAEKSAAQVLCEKRGNVWAKAGKNGLRACVKRTSDGGKRCVSGDQCQGQCLARSGTCAPFTPLFGCNEILQDDGSRVTLCID